MKHLFVLLFAFTFICCTKKQQQINVEQPKDTLYSCPTNNEWEEYIRNFPRKQSTVVRDYQGNIIKQSSLGVLDTRVTEVQQCADAAIRLRAEFFYGRKEYDNIKFKLTCGLEVPFSKWAKGYRVNVTGNNARLVKQMDSNDYSRENFEDYLYIVMMYAGSASLYRDLYKVVDFPPRIGDLLIIPGYPGHVVIVIDKKKKDGINYYLFANSWIPAQDIEIISGSNTHWNDVENIDGYVPIKSPEDQILINGYLFQINKNCITWQDLN